MTSLQTNYSDTSHLPPHILIMEDEKSIARGLEMVLTEEGYDVDLAYTGEDALKTFYSNEFDILIADLRLPDIDGLEVVRLVKERRPQTEVVVITGYSSVASAVDAMKIGVADYLSKPFTESEVKTAIGDALRKAAEREGPEPERVSALDEEKLIQKREVIRVLERTLEDGPFWWQLMENVPGVLSEYHLSSEARAAIMSGDLMWIKRNVGELTEKQLAFIYQRLEREAW